MYHCLRNLILLLLSLTISLKSGVMEAQKVEWCVADEKTPKNELQAALDWVCGIGGANCTEIQENGACFLPNTLKDHASYAFNYYYQKMKTKGASCNFNSTARVISCDPSYDGCKYPLDG